MAQVPPLFPHLCHHTPSPAPARPITCAGTPSHQHALSPAPAYPITCAHTLSHLHQHPLLSSQCPSLMPMGVGLWVLAQVGIDFGAGETLNWRRCASFLAQVRPWIGAGEVFGRGPAPQIGRLWAPVAQVPPLFPHLRQHTPSPAPSHPFTCASISFRLCKHALSPAPAHPPTCPNMRN